MLSSYIYCSFVQFIFFSISSTGANDPPAEPSHNALGQRGSERSAGRSLQVEVCLCWCTQPLQEMISVAPDSCSCSSSSYRSFCFPTDVYWTLRPLWLHGRTSSYLDLPFPNCPMGLSQLIRDLNQPITGITSCVALPQLVERFFLLF